MSDKPSRTTFRKRLDEMVSQLREEIVAGKRAIGEFLPSEQALGEQFQLSKNSVRKGLDMLVAEGLIEKVPRVGNRVASPDEEGVQTVKFGYYPSVLQEGLLNRVLADFHGAFPHIRVRSIPLPYDQFAGTVAEYMRSDLLDVITINYTDYRHMAENGWTDLLEELEPNPELYPFLSGVFADGCANRALPFIFSPIVLCYNRDHFAEKQLPEPDSGWSWDELLTSAKKLSENQGRYGFYFHLLSDNRWPVFLLQSGVRFVPGSEEYDEGLRRSLTLFRHIQRDRSLFPNYMSESDADAEDLFLQGKLSMIMSTYFSLNRFIGAPFAFDVAPLPYMGEAKTLLLTIGAALSRHSKVKEAARTFLDYMLSYPVQLNIRQRTLSIPANKKAAEWQGKEVMARPTRFHMYREIIPTFRKFTELNLAASQLQTVRKELKLFWSGMEDEETVIRRLKSQLFPVGAGT
jgi:ABC-type sugar transport system, periplasmic component